MAKEATMWKRNESPHRKNRMKNNNAPKMEQERKDMEEKYSGEGRILK